MLTLECLIGTLISILIRMRKQTQLPISLFDLAIGGGRFGGLETENVVEGGGAAFAYAEDGGLLFDGIGAVGAAVVVFVSFFCVC